MGATTIWERWDGLNENGECLISEDGTADVMISYNHYASGAVGDFFYRRILGVEPLCGGYQKVCIAPMPGGSLTWARGKVTTPYGLLTTGWKWEEDMFSFYCEIPIGIHAVVRMPNGEEQELDSGTYKKEMIWIRKKNEEDIA